MSLPPCSVGKYVAVAYPGHSHLLFSTNHEAMLSKYVKAHTHLCSGATFVVFGLSHCHLSYFARVISED